MRAVRPCREERTPTGHRRAGFHLLLCLAALLTAAAVRSAGAEEPRVAWGVVPPADLAMTSFPADTNARAVVLYDYGELSIDQHDQPVLFRHRRIKILSENAYDRWGTVTIPYWEGGQEVSHIEASTTVLAPDGSESHFYLDPASIFDEKVTGKYHRKKFTLPGLTPGCVIEYRYRVTPSLIRDWRFQCDEPTVWSEFRMERYKTLEYTMIQQAIAGFDVNETRDIPDLAQPFRSRVAHRWALGNTPALRREPFMTTPEDYWATLRFQVTRYMDSERQMHEILGTWEKLVGDLLGSESFGAWLKPPGALSRQARDLARGVTDPAEVMRRVHACLRSAMTWTGEYSVVSGGTPEQAVKTQRGNSAAFGLLLTGMLREAGLEANPVLISTRDNGRPVDVFPLARQFNHVLAHVQVGTREYLLDATDSLRTWDLLPYEALNGSGFLVSRDDPGWVDIASPRTPADTVRVDAVLAADGTITGRLEARERGYRALESRHDLRDKKEKDHIRERWLSGFADARLDSFTVANRDSLDAPLLTRVWFSAVGQAQAAGNRLYLNPVLFGRLKQNPLTLPTRTFPVDFGYGSASSYVLSLTLPEGFRVEERPADLRLTVGREAAQFVRTVQAEGNTLILVVNREIRQPVFQPAEYRGLRDYYNKLVTALGEQVVLAGPGAAGGAR